MKHITHLEDLLFLEGPYAVSEWLMELDKHPPTIKYDGAPAVVYGTLADGRPFVSTKSFFNKTPKYYTSYEELTLGVKDAALRTKLAVLLQAVVRHPAPHNTIIMGDMLFWSSSPDANVCPNIVTYTLPDGVRRTHELGVAVHTNIAGEGYANPEIWTPPTVYLQLSHMARSIMNLIALQQRDEHELQTLIDGLSTDARQLLCGVVNHLYRNKRGLVIVDGNLTPSMATYIISNALSHRPGAEELVGDVRKHPELYGRLLTVYCTLLRCKEQLIAELEPQAQRAIKARLDSRVKHEGYVLNNVKLVTRTLFSTMNFQSTTARGWSKSK